MDTVILWGFDKAPRFKAIPEGLYLVALALRRRGYEVKIRLLPREFIDGVKARLPEVAQLPPGEYHRLFPALKAFLPEAADPKVVFHGLQTYEGDLNYLAVLVSFLKAASPALLVGGGPLATLAPRVALEVAGVDLALRGECEESVVILAELLARRQIRRQTLAAHLHELKQVPGIALPLPSGECFLHEQIPWPDPLPFLPEEVDFWQECRRAVFPGAATEACTYQITASRGCPRRCVFCSHANGRRHRRYRLPEITARLLALAEGVARLQAAGTLGRVCLNFGDDDFFCHRRYALQLLTLFHRHELARLFDIVVCGSIPSFLRRGGVDEELADALRQAGVALLQLGTDAFCDAEIRRLKGGGYTTTDIEAVVEGLERHRVRNHHFWVLSGPGTTVGDLVRQLLTAFRLQLTYRYFFVLWPNFYLMPLLGSPLREEGRHPDWQGLMVEKRILGDACRRRALGQAGRFYDRVRPADPRAAALLARLEQELPPQMQGRVPYGFDFPAALALAREYLEGEYRRQPDQELEECRRLLEAATLGENAA